MELELGGIAAELAAGGQYTTSVVEGAIPKLSKGRRATQSVGGLEGPMSPLASPPTDGPPDGPPGMRIALFPATASHFAQPNSLEWEFACEWRKMQAMEEAESMRLAALQLARRSKLLLAQRIRFVRSENRMLELLEQAREALIALGDPAREAAERQRLLQVRRAACRWQQRPVPWVARAATAMGGVSGACPAHTPSSPPPPCSQPAAHLHPPAAPPRPNTSRCRSWRQSTPARSGRTRPAKWTSCCDRGQAAAATRRGHWQLLLHLPAPRPLLGPWTWAPPRFSLSRASLAAAHPRPRSFPSRGTAARAAASPVSRHFWVPVSPGSSSSSSSSSRRHRRRRSSSPPSSQLLPRPRGRGSTRQRSTRRCPRLGRRSKRRRRCGGDGSVDSEARLACTGSAALRQHAQTGYG